MPLYSINQWPDISLIKRLDKWCLFEASYCAPTPNTLPKRSTFHMQLTVIEPLVIDYMLSSNDLPAEDNS